MSRENNSEVAQRKFILSKIKNKRSKREFLKKQPLAVENDKQLILFSSNKLGEARRFFHDIKELKTGVANMELFKNSLLFEDKNCLDKFFHKFDSSLFMLGNNNKKRPNNLIMGRCFNHKILDMYEMEITNLKTRSEFGKSNVTIAANPILSFNGFLNDGDNMKMFYFKNLLIDMFRGPKVQYVNRDFLELAYDFTNINNEIVSMKTYTFKSDNVNGHREVTEVKEIGPSCEFKMRRVETPTPEVWKMALKKPKVLEPKKKKNIEKDVLGNVLGRVHVANVDNDEMISTVMSSKNVRKRTAKFAGIDDN